jgi:hypothetical protein
MDKKAKILTEIEKAGFPEKEVAVSMDDFFEENNDPASIGVNLYPHQPTPQDFYDVFKKIKASDKTENIFVRISDAEEGQWFYSDAVYIVGNWTSDEIKEMVKDLKPDEIYEGWMYGKPVNISQTNNKVLSLWWD